MGVDVEAGISDPTRVGVGICNILGAAVRVIVGTIVGADVGFSVGDGIPLWVVMGSSSFVVGEAVGD